MVHADMMINMFLSSGTTDAPLLNTVTSQGLGFDSHLTLNISPWNMQIT